MEAFARRRQREAGYPLKVVILPLLARLTLAYRHRLTVTTTVDKLLSGLTLMTLNDLELPK